MTQALYAHMNNKKIKIKKKRCGVLLHSRETTSNNNVLYTSKAKRKEFLPQINEKYLSKYMSET
jgi:hypothetical protein